MFFTDMNKDELIALKTELDTKYEEMKAKKLNLNMSRGKPSPDQVAVSFPVLDEITAESDLHAEDCTDCTNYGGLDGITEARKLFGDILGTDPDNVMVMGNSSLNIMFDQVSRGFTHGYCGNRPWHTYDKVKFLCPVPGYDRHFLVTEHFGIEMINVPMNEDGPDMDMVEEIVSKDETVKGIWCVPKYSNPTGITFSNEVIRRLASLKPSAKDFRIFYDNAYCMHDLYDESIDLPDMIKVCEEAGNPDIVFEFASTSKITFPGAGIACIAASENNIKEIRNHLKIQTIGHDKLNQLRHARFFKNADGVREHMKKHADYIRPKFEAVLEGLKNELDGTGTGTWTSPKGGYFISFETIPGCAARVYELCKDAGVVLTGVGATYPYGKDPEDSNLRIAPTYPTVDELRAATEVFALAVKIASIEKLLKER